MSWEAASHDEAKRQDREDSDWYAREATWLFMDGARWQRSSLRTDEAVERVARGICRRNWPKNEDFVHYWRWYCDDFRADASAAIDALRGEDA